MLSTVTSWISFTQGTSTEPDVTTWSRLDSHPEVMEPETRVSYMIWCNPGNVTCTMEMIIVDPNVDFSLCEIELWIR